MCQGGPMGRHLEDSQGQEQSGDGYEGDREKDEVRVNHRVSFIAVVRIY